MILYGFITSNIKSYLDLLNNPWARVQTLDDLVPPLLTLILVVAVVVFLFLLIIGGIRWITAGGDKAALEGAQKTITSALIGIVLVLSAWAILRLVRYFFRLDTVQVTCLSEGAACGATGQLPCCSGICRDCGAGYNECTPAGGCR